VGTVDYDALKRIGTDLLTAIGEDPERPGIVDTPRRFADWWREFIEYDPGVVDTTFEAETVDQLVVVKGMGVWSLCEHHLLPFRADVTIGYITDGKVLGLSKFARIAHKHAHSLQLQERLCQQIGDEVAAVTGSQNVAVLASGEHLCMTMRGIQTPALMRSSSLRGLFREDHRTRDEFLRMAGL